MLAVADIALLGEPVVEPAAAAMPDPLLPASNISLIGRFETWNGGVIRSTDVSGLTFHPPSGNLFIVDSEINEIAGVFNGDNIFEISLSGDTVFREIASRNSEPTGITYNEFDGFFYVTNDNNGRLERYDDRLNSPLLSIKTKNDVEGAIDPEGVTSNPADGMLFVVDGSSGGNQILAYDSNLVFQYSFSFDAVADDAEGIAYDTETSHLFIVSDVDKAIYEFTVDGEFVEEYDMSTFPVVPQSPQGLSFGPTSDPDDDPAARSLYIADAMVDNFEDGMIFEVRLNRQVAQAPGVFVEENTISTDAKGAYSVFAADVDGDGDVDVLSASADDNKIAWHENDGSGGFTEHIISSEADGARSVFAIDMDGDGDVDVLSASFRDNKIAWYENDGDENFTSHVISTDPDGATSVFAIDMDGDGDVDVLSTSRDDDTLAWYENDGSGGFTPHIISTTADGPRSVFAADLDGDGDVDVVAAFAVQDWIAWYENKGSEGFRIRRISEDADGARSVFGVDLDGDGDIDLLSASGINDKIAWHENDGKGRFTSHTISTAASGASSVFAADVDGDGDIDVLSASRFDNKIVWYENDGSQQFTARTLSTNADGARAVVAADLDGDGDVEIISASYFDNKIAWYDPTPFTPIDSLGSLVFETSVAASIDEPGQFDTRTISLSQGQNITLVMRSTGSLKGSISLADPSGAILAEATSLAAGQSVVLQSIATTTAGDYTVAVGGADDTTGDFSVQLILGAAFEAETEGGPANNTAAEAVILDDGFLPLGAGPAERAAVIGALETEDSDWYRLRLDDGQSLTLALTTGAAGGATLDLYDAALEHLATSIALSSSASSIGNFVDTSTDGEADDYFVRISGEPTDYSLLVTRDLQFDLEPNDHSAAYVQDITLTGSALGFIDGAVGGDVTLSPDLALLFEPVVFGVIGDYGGGGKPEADVAAMIKTWDPQFIVSVGDNNYGNVGIGAEDSWEERVGRFYGDYILGRSDHLYPNQTSPTQRFYPTVGNHDDTKPENVQAGYLDYFFTDPSGVDRLPFGGGVHEESKNYYSFQKDNVQFFIVDSIIDGNPEKVAEEKAWLEQSLAESTAQWKFVFMHHTSYSSGNHGSVRKHQWPFEAWGADAVLYGHDHNYERLEVDGIPYFVNGAGGQSLRDVGAPIPESQLIYNAAYGAMRVTVDGLVARFEFLSIADGASGAAGGQVIDTLTINKGQLDRYDVEVNAGDELSIDVAASPLRPNGLDPAVELFDPTGQLVAAADSNDDGPGRSATILYTAGQAGTYSIVVNAAIDTAGEYLLRVDGQTAAAAPFAVRQSLPSGDFPLAQPPTQIFVEFDNLLRLDTLSASDLTVDGQRAASVTVIDGHSAVFDLASEPGDGVHEVRIAAGRILDVQGVPIESYTGSFSVDGISPTVVGVQVGSTRWQAAFAEQISGGENDPFYSIPVVSGEQLATLPWRGIDAIRIMFNEDVIIRVDDLTVTGVNVTEHPLRDFIYDPINLSATWFLERPLKSDKLLLDLSGVVRDVAGNTLDGDWTDGTGRFPSGDGVVGDNIEDFRFRLNVLPGDVDRDGSVARSDLLETIVAQGVEAGQIGYRPERDVDADGRIGMSDLRAVIRLQASRLPTAEPAPASNSVAGSAVDEFFGRLGGANSPSPAVTPLDLTERPTHNDRSRRVSNLLPSVKRFPTPFWRSMSQRRSTVERGPLAGAAVDELIAHSGGEIRATARSAARRRSRE